ncbi:hypothetical protein [Streptomyces prunicolor]|uniref:hypothetical protein n=1 Tax=Streptomyces prunicolor TaxID=67348 RepID=UPI000368B941|nr:hypothetical protein [Streptomyces prunicolor]
MSEQRLWAPEGASEEGQVRPHVLWLPHDQPDVLAYLARVREILTPYADIITPVAECDAHMTAEKLAPHDRDGGRVDEERLLRAAPFIQECLAGLVPFGIEIGPPRASASAAVMDVWPETVLHEFYLCLRAGCSDAGLTMAPVAEWFWGHISGGYGLLDTNTPTLAERSDRLASELGRGLRPGSRVSASISSVWLVLEHQDVVNNQYTFRRVREIHLGRTERVAA